MLGDAGSNALGALLGLNSVKRFTGRGQWVAIGALAGLTLIGERTSLGALIERTPGLALARPAGTIVSSSSRPTKYVFVTGGVVSSLGKGIIAASLGRLLKARGLQGAGAEVRPVPERRPGHDEPVPARRGVRHRGRRRDRSRHRPLRALHRREPVAQRRTTPPARSGTRCSARSARASTSAATVQVIPHITNEIKARIRRGGVDADRRRDHRDRRHGRRHRVAAVPGGDPPVPARGRSRERALPPRHARPVHRGGRRAEDEADAALGQRAAANRYPPRHRRLPLARRALRRHPREDRALRRRRARSGDREPGRSRRLSRSLARCKRKASTSSSARSSACRRRKPTSASGSI